MQLFVVFKDERFFVYIPLSHPELVSGSSG